MLLIQAQYRRSGRINALVLLKIGERSLLKGERLKSVVARPLLAFRLCTFCDHVAVVDRAQTHRVVRGGSIRSVPMRRYRQGLLQAPICHCARKSVGVCDWRSDTIAVDEYDIGFVSRSRHRNGNCFALGLSCGKSTDARHDHDGAAHAIDKILRERA